MAAAVVRKIGDAEEELLPVSHVQSFLTPDELLSVPRSDMQSLTGQLLR